MDLQKIKREVSAVKSAVSETTKVELIFRDVPDDDIFAIAMANDDTNYHRASPAIPYNWCRIYDNNIEVLIKGVTKKYKSIN